jgi:hypothetical protein
MWSFAFTATWHACPQSVGLGSAAGFILPSAGSILDIWYEGSYALCGADVALGFHVSARSPAECASMPALSAFPRIAALFRNHIRSARGSEENGMEMMKIHVLERALTFACIVAALAVVLWGIKILTA